MAKKMRADQLLFEKGLAESREKAKRQIMAGQAYIVRPGHREPIQKPGQQLTEDLELALKSEDRFVSRGGYKLLTAIEAFRLNLEGAVVLDAGASTGGFTDCALQHGAVKVYAADVGYGQLHEKLRQDPRVVNLERVNLRHAGPDLLPEGEQVDLVTMDVSFISVTLVLPPCLQFLRPGGAACILIKPQFEVGPGQTDKGVVRDQALRDETVARITAFCETDLGLTHKGTVPSSILGPKGNQEYVAYFVKD